MGFQLNVCRATNYSETIFLTKASQMNCLSKLRKAAYISSAQLLYVCSTQLENINSISSPEL
jgi:hypothetical protein